MKKMLPDKERSGIVRLADAALHLVRNATEGEWEYDGEEQIVSYTTGETESIVFDPKALVSDMELMANSKKMLYKMSGTIHRLLNVIDGAEGRQCRRKRKN